MKLSFLRNGPLAEWLCFAIPNAPHLPRTFRSHLQSLNGTSALKNAFGQMIGIGQRDSAPLLPVFTMPPILETAFWNFADGPIFTLQ